MTAFFWQVCLRFGLMQRKIGYIIRYPQGMQKITGYAYEAWHIRYVGKKVATFMMRHHFTLEQYVQYEQFLKVHHITP